MSQKFEKLIEKAGSEYSLSSDERAKMTRVVREYMSYKPLPHAESYSITVSYRWFSFAHRPLAAALVLVLVFGSSVSYAAENALPGDALYSIKTYVNEPTRLALASGAEAKAEIQIEFAERRIEEATVLAAEGRLDAATQDDLAVAFESHAAAASENIQATDDTDSPAAAELASRFETRLAAHDEILAEVQSDDSAETHGLSDAIRSAGRIVAEIRTHAEEKAEVSAPLETALLTGQAKVATFAATTARAEDTAEQSTTTAEVSRSAALRMQKAANKQYETIRKKADKNNEKIAAEARASIDAELMHAEELIAIGEDQMAEGEIALAFHSFQSSLVITEKLSVMLKAAPTLAKANSRRGSDPIRDAARSNGAGFRVNSTMQATATMEIVAPIPVEIHIENTTEGDVKIQNVLPRTIQIFPSGDDNDSDDSKDKGSGKIKIDISL